MQIKHANYFVICPSRSTDVPSGAASVFVTVDFLRDDRALLQLKILKNFVTKTGYLLQKSLQNCNAKLLTVLESPKHNSGLFIRTLILAALSHWIGTRQLTQP